MKTQMKSEMKTQMKSEVKSETKSEVKSEAEATAEKLPEEADKESLALYNGVISMMLLSTITFSLVLSFDGEAGGRQGL